MWNLVALTLLLWNLGSTLSSVHKSSFDSAQLVIDGDKTNTAFEFNITFRPTRIIGVNEVIVVRLPRFTRGLIENVTAENMTYGNVMIAPSYFFIAKWLAGKNTNDDGLDPYSTAELHIMPLYNVTFAKQAAYTITVFKENGIGAVCGFPSIEAVNATGELIYPFKHFEILTALATESPTYMPTYMPSHPTLSPTINPTALPTAVDPTPDPTAAPTMEVLFYRNDSYKFDYYSGVGQGCKALLFCHKQGRCDFCHEKCHCYDGFGSSADLVSPGRDVQPDCRSSKFHCRYYTLLHGHAVIMSLLDGTGVYIHIALPPTCSFAQTKCNFLASHLKYGALC